MNTNLLHAAASILLCLWLVCFFWQTLRTQHPRMSSARQWALFLGGSYLLAYFLVMVFSLGGFLEVFREARAVSLLIWVLPSSVASAVLIVEMIRTTIRKNPDWSDKLHFSAVGLTWSIMFAIQWFVISKARGNLP
jgi:hypothetical protein